MLTQQSPPHSIVITCWGDAIQNGGLSTPLRPSRLVSQISNQRGVIVNSPMEQRRQVELVIAVRNSHDTSRAFGCIPTALTKLHCVYSGKWSEPNVLLYCCTSTTSAYVINLSVVEKADRRRGGKSTDPLSGGLRACQSNQGPERSAAAASAVCSVPPACVWSIRLAPGRLGVGVPA